MQQHSNDLLIPPGTVSAQLGTNVPLNLPLHTPGNARLFTAPKMLRRQPPRQPITETTNQQHSGGSHIVTSSSRGASSSTFTPSQRGYLDTLRGGSGQSPSANQDLNHGPLAQPPITPQFRPHHSESTSFQVQSSDQQQFYTIPTLESSYGGTTVHGAKLTPPISFHIAAAPSARPAPVFVHSQRPMPAEGRGSRQQPSRSRPPPPSLMVPSTGVLNSQSSGLPSTSSEGMMISQGSTTAHIPLQQQRQQCQQHPFGHSILAVPSLSVALQHPQQIQSQTSSTGAMLSSGTDRRSGDHAVILVSTFFKSGVPIRILLPENWIGKRGSTNNILAVEHGLYYELLILCIIGWYWLHWICAFDDRNGRLRVHLLVHSTPQVLTLWLRSFLFRTARLCGWKRW